MAKAYINKVYIYLESLSVDIVLGACAGMLFFDRLIGADLNPVIYILLAMAVWCIYTFDHLLDARQIDKQASTFRHAFHQRYFKPLAFFFVLVGTLGLGGALYLFKISHLVTYGFCLGVLILLIFILLKIVPKNWVFLKEISISGLYVVGIMLAPYFQHDWGVIPPFFWLFGIAYVLVAWFNTVFLGILDQESDQKDGLYSFALAVGESRSRKFLFVLMGIMLIYIVSLFWILDSFSYFHVSIILLIALIHSNAFLKTEEDRDVVRRKLDASFMLPFLLLLI